MNTALMKFSGHNVVGTSSSENEESDSDSQIEIDFHQINQDKY